MYSPEYGRIQYGLLNCTHQATPIVYKGRDRLKAKQIARFWDRLCQLQDLLTSTLCLLQDLVASTTVTVARSFHRLIVCASQTQHACGAQLEDSVWQAHSLCASHKIFSQAHCAGCQDCVGRRLHLWQDLAPSCLQGIFRGCGCGVYKTGG